MKNTPPPSVDKKPASNVIWHPYKGSNDLITASATQFTDQGVVFVGKFTQFNGVAAPHIARVI